MREGLADSNKRIREERAAAGEICPVAAGAVNRTPAYAWPVGGHTLCLG